MSTTGTASPSPARPTAGTRSCATAAPVMSPRSLSPWKTRTPSPNPTAATGGNSSTNSLAQQIVDFALQYVGYPYVYGTAGPDTFDCSGFTYYVYAHFGYSLNRSSGIR